VDFAWTATQTDLYDRALAFARAQLGAVGAFDREAFRRCGEFGLLGLCVPAEHGGLGLDAVTTARVVEAFGRGSPNAGLIFAACAHLFAATMPVAEHGAPELQRAVLPRLCTGEWVGANAITEAEAGSDVFALRTRATRAGDDYVLTGAKTYVTNGPVADAFVVYATMDPAHGFLGVTAFLIERGAPGLTLGAPFEKTGLTGALIGALYLDECRVPARQRLGAEGQGAAVFRASMLWERACLFALYVGAMERQLEEVIAHARQRRQFGRAIGKHQAIAHRIADMRLRLEAARLLLYQACWTKDRGLDPTVAISMAKLAISEAAVQSGLDAVRIFGGAGVMAETGVARGLDDALPGTIFSGTSEIQRDLIARGLGL
jgi:alkylation response protein AidB-like acyl-CoA dehydrogenase